jgi:hypothetical protein
MKEWIMKESLIFSAGMFVSLLLVLSPATTKADLWDVPVAPGETFRWVFVTSVTTDATSSDIIHYNDFVNSLADVATPITGVLGKSTIADIEWKAIVSTDEVDAIDNIGPSTSIIYTPTGGLIANGITDMFDGGLAGPINITETGASPPQSSIWSGTNEAGTRLSGLTMGSEPVMTGIIDVYTVRWWINSFPLSAPTSLPIYAMSEDLTVVPVPGALILGATGLLSSTLGLKRLRRKR